MRSACTRYFYNLPLPFVLTAPISKESASSFRFSSIFRLLFSCSISITSSGISQLSIFSGAALACTTLPNMDYQSAKVFLRYSRSTTEPALLLLLVACLLFCIFSSLAASKVFSRLVVFCLALRALLTAGLASSLRFRRGMLPILAMLCLLVARTAFWLGASGISGRRGMSASKRFGRDCAALLLLREMPFCLLQFCSSTGQVWQGCEASFILEACKLDSLAEVRLSLDSKCLQQFLISSSSFFNLRSFSNFSISFCLRLSSTWRSSSAFISRLFRSSCCCSVLQNSLESRPRLWLRCSSSFIFYLSNIKLLLATINQPKPESLLAELRGWENTEQQSLGGSRMVGCYKVGYYLDSNQKHGFRRQPAFSLTQADDPPSRQHLAGVQLKPIELLCHIHTDQPCNNYCVEGKCFQPLCSECIEGHLILHKKNGYSDLSVKSLRGVRRDCVGRLGALIDELIRRLEQLEAPPSAERIAEVLQARLEQAQKEAHQIIELEFTRLRDSLRSRINESSNILKGMADIHGKLEELIEQMKENCSTLVQGQRGSVSISDCIRSTLTLNQQALLDMFDKESVAYEARRRKIEFQVSFNPELFRSALAEALKIGVSTKQPAISEASFSRPKMRNNLEESSEWDNSINATLPVQAQPQEGNRLLHFFETGSSRLHLIDVEGRKKIDSKVVTISEFIVPSFHASLVSQNGQFIYLSGGLVELNGRSKSPLFMRYNIRSQVTKKDFAKVTPRSSHSLCQDKNGDIFILGGYGQSQQNDQESVYLTTVERVSERTGKVEVQPDSRWGGSNIAFRCKDLILKACEEGIQLYNPKQRQWTTVDIRTKSQDFNFYKSAGFACLSESEVLIFGGYQHDLQPADSCFYWRLSLEGNRPAMHIKELGCRLPVAQGFDNGKAVVDERGCFALQNIQDDEESCVDNERRLLRFDLKQGEGEWRELQIISN